MKPINVFETYRKFLFDMLGKELGSAFGPKERAVVNYLFKVESDKTSPKEAFEKLFAHFGNVGQRMAQFQSSRVEKEINHETRTQSTGRQ